MGKIKIFLSNIKDILFIIAYFPFIISMLITFPHNTFFDSLLLILFILTTLMLIYKIFTTTHSIFRFFLKRIWNENELFNASNNIVSISSWNEFAQRLIELRELHEAVCYYNNWKNNFGSVKQISQFIIENPQLAHDYLRKYNKMVA